MPTQVLSLHRFPVKSMSGEQLDRLDLDERGVAGDRLWSVRTADGKIGSGKNTRRFAAVPGLLRLRAEVRDGEVVVTFPDGSSCCPEDADADERVSRYVGQPVTFARESDVLHFDDGPVSLAGRGSVHAVAAAGGSEVEPVRFRANLVLDTAVPFVEDGWVGRLVRVGSAVLRVELTSRRCVMVDMATADLPAQPGNLLTVGSLNDTRLGVIAAVVAPGSIAVGDVLTVDDQ